MNNGQNNELESKATSLTRSSRVEIQTHIIFYVITLVRNTWTMLNPHSRDLAFVETCQWLSLSLLHIIYMTWTSEVPPPSLYRPLKNKSRLLRSIDLWRISPASSYLCLWEITWGFWMMEHNKLCRWRRRKSCVTFWTTHFFHLVSTALK